MDRNYDGCTDEYSLSQNLLMVIYKCREPIILLPVSNLSSILTLSLMEQELLTFLEHLSSPPVLVGFVLLDLWFYMYDINFIMDTPFLMPQNF
jgi:hypothetical protein